MTLFGPLHLTLLAAIALAGMLLVRLCRRGSPASRTVRLMLGIGLAVNELGWWGFRYSHEGVHLRNLPLQLCDVTLWMTSLACITLAPALVEFAYFAGFAGAAMALLTPDLWEPWPSYPAIYFFVAHGGIVVGIAVLVIGGAHSACYWATRFWPAHSMRSAERITPICAASPRIHPYWT